jgi:uncharacterized membrane protein YbhN (UPF0104 family)
MLRRAALVVVVIILAVELWYVAPQVRHYWQETKNVRWLWVGACVLAAAASMESFSQVQRTLFASADVRVSTLRSTAEIYAANSISCSLPAGQVLATAFAYRQTRRWGATTLVASWQIVMSGLLKGSGLALIGFGGAFLAGVKTTPFSLIFMVGGFLAFLFLAQFIASRPEDMSALSSKVFALVNRLRKRPPEEGLLRWQQLLEQAQAVRLSRLDGLKAFSWSMTNWLADIACLACACYATDAHPSLPGLLTAYALGKTAAVAVPLLPGGLGVVELVLVPTLTGSGVPSGAAFSAVVIYRLVSFLLVTAVGWVVFFLVFRKSDPIHTKQPDEFDQERLQTNSSKT